MEKEKIKERFYCSDTGFIWERNGKKDKRIADFFGGCPEVSDELLKGTQEKRDRIIRLLNLGFKEEENEH